ALAKGGDKPATDPATAKPRPRAAAPKEEGRPAGDKGNAKDKGDRPKVPIPTNLATLPVLQDINRQEGRADPKEDSDEPILGKTDNSNSQFALLALWAAQRHGVPVDRTMARVVRRYRGSQNSDGGWSYTYAPGGGTGSAPAMTCVGLIGLAVGH